MTDSAGTANILHQFTAYNQLRDDYSPEVANVLTQKNLARHNVPATPEDVDAWHRINTAAVNSKLDIPAERRIADTLAGAAVAAILETASTGPVADVSDTIAADDEDFSENEIQDEEDELPSLADMYGYDNDEDNEEAALDDVLKAQERAD